MDFWIGDHAYGVDMPIRILAPLAGGNVHNLIMCIVRTYWIVLAGRQ